MLSFQCGIKATALGVFVVMSIKLSMASTPINVVSPSTLAEQEREQALRLEQLEKANDSVSQLQNVPTLPKSDNVESVECFDVHSLSFEGNEIYSDEELVHWLNFSPSCIGLNEINEYLRVITNHYVKSGYVTSRAFLIPQDLSSGVLKIVILEGKIEQILLNGAPSPSLNMVLPRAVGGVLNLRDIEQGLEQINRLSRYNAQIQFLPGKKQGYSIVDIKTEQGRIVSASTGLSNGGQKSTGEEQLSFSISAEDMLNLFDKWTISATKSAAFVDSRDSESLYFSLDFPIGYWNVGYRSAFSKYSTNFTSNDFVFDSAGKTNSHDADIKWLFYRDDKSKSSFRLGINHRREKNYLLDQLLESSSRDLSSASFSWEHSTRLGDGFLTISPKYSLGTDWFGGEENRSSDPTVPKAQFSKGTISGSYTHFLSNELILSSTFFGQWSNDTLYGGERISIGGEYSVRGFKGKSLSGDEGYYWRNDLTRNVSQYPYLGQVSLNVALDMGSIAKDPVDESERGSLAGASFGIKTRSKHASSSLSLGLPLAFPSQLKADDYVVYYRLELSI
ncbi:ShlB/FhaC/HecB family hemolysin secretion/activation protein [Vibrio ostreicida]|uniref:ShlB/FhaC/HecB family hemolysin secretion/activation protein n=1 Tax=Vibrio ostreicida TaxID=526588 RepID=UPI003B5A4B8D